MTQDTLTRTSTTPSDAPEADSTTDAGSTPVVRTVGLERVHLTETLETAALGGVDLTIEDGEFVAVMGPSGSGKSTLLNILGLLDRPTGGRYELHGRDVTDLTARRRTDLRKEHMGFVFQAFNLIDELTVEENVEMPLLYHGMSVDARRQRIDELLARIGLDHRKRHFPKQLSGGQQQRVAVARAVATR
ncbi:MAG: ABC transporter ATP-binding protein, partial [Acidobacteriota bacterium]